MSDNRSSDLKVGELARRSGVSVRTLHHYDEIGLLRPKRHTPVGHRVYGRDAPERLAQIRALREIGLSLEEIAQCIGRPRASLAAVVARARRAAQVELVVLQRRVACLDAAAEYLGRGEPVAAEELAKVVEHVSICAEHLTPAQSEAFHSRVEELGPARVGAHRRASRAYFARMRALMERGADPADARVQRLVAGAERRAAELSGGDAALQVALVRVVEHEPRLQRRQGIDAPLLAFLRRAAAVRASG